MIKMTCFYIFIFAITAPATFVIVDRSISQGREVIVVAGACDPQLNRCQ